jgi:predicted ArsR family transcriptional regulator
MPYTPIQQKIMRLLYQTKAPLTAYEIAKELEISFPTAKAHLKKLVEENIIIEDESDGTYQEI